MSEGTYALVPVRIGVWHKISKGIKRRLIFLFLALDDSLRIRTGRCRNSTGFCYWLRSLLFLRCWGGSRLFLLLNFLRVQRADLQLGLVFLENALIVVLPELLRGVFAGDAGEDLFATCCVVNMSANCGRLMRLLELDVRMRCIAEASPGTRVSKPNCDGFLGGSGLSRTYLDARPGTWSSRRHPHRR